MSAPVLSTPRLTLSPPDPADLDEAATMWTHPDVYGPITGRPFTREEMWQRLLRYIGHWQVAGYGTWTLRAHDGTYMGEVGLMDSRRDTVPSFEGTPEAGWALAPHAHGQGYAAEALAAMLGWADARGIERIMCIINPDNAPSIRLAARFAFRPLGQARYKDAPVNLYERIAP